MHFFFNLLQIVCDVGLRRLYFAFNEMFNETGRKCPWNCF